MDGEQGQQRVRSQREITTFIVPGMMLASALGVPLMLLVSLWIGVPVWAAGMTLIFVGGVRGSRANRSGRGND